MNDFDLEFSNNPIIKVIGVGGGGSNAVVRMREQNVHGVEFVVVNTDAQALRNATKVDTRIQIGRELTKGLGAGADPEIGRKAAEESLDEIDAVIQDANMVFITAGMGGGTGTGAAPVIAKRCYNSENCDLTVAVVTKPFSFEGKARMENALNGIEELRPNVDTLLIIPNDKLRYALRKDITVIDAFYEADKVLRSGVQGISDLITYNGLINVDFADIRKVMKNCGTAVMGIGSASGANKTIEAVRQALNSPLLENNLNGAKDAIVSFSSGKGFKLNEVTAAVEEIKNHSNTGLDIIYGQFIQEELEDEVLVTIIATGFKGHMTEEERNRLENPEEVVEVGKNKVPTWVVDLFNDN